MMVRARLVSTVARATGLLLSVASVLTASGCDDGRGVTPNTGAAVSGAVRRVSENLGRALTAQAPAAQQSAGDALRVFPEVRVTGTGALARLSATEDASHRGVQTAQTPEGFAMSWGDDSHTHAVFARADRQGRPLGEPVIVHEAQSDEEEVWAPSVAFNGDEYGVAWCDPANGRVQFQRFDARGRALGRASTVHMGLAMPMGTRIMWTGDGYAVAAAVSEGVYFARVDRAGARAGDGLMVVEGERVGDLDELTATATGFAIGWHEPEGAQKVARVSRDGRRVEGVEARRGPQVAMR